MGKVITSRVSFLTPEGRVIYMPGDELKPEHESYVTNPGAFRTPAEFVEQVTDRDNIMIKAEAEPVLEEMSYPALLKMAKNADIEFEGNPKKQDVIAALQANALNAEDEELL
jgi:hypothetical protein